MDILNFFTSAPFLLIGFAGLAALLVAAALDGIFDAFDFGDGPVSLTTVAAFLALFGFVAAGLQYTGMDTTLTVLCAAVAGILASVGAWQMSRFFKTQSTSASHSTSSIVGAKAVVRLRIQEGSVGEITLRRNGHLHTYTAKAASTLVEGTLIVITSVISDTLVFVEPALRQVQVTEAEAGEELVATGDFEGVTEAQIREWADEAEKGYDFKN